MLANIIKKYNSKIEPYKNDIFTAVVIILIAIVGFGLGRLSAIYEQKTPINIEYLGGPQENKASATHLSRQDETSGEKLYVASKNSDKYHFEWCSGAQRIKEENKIWFSSKEEAESKGFSPAENCEGL